MENLAHLAPLLILIPALGAIINLFGGRTLGEKASGIVGATASGLTFLVALLLYAYLRGNDYVPALVKFPIIGDWIRIDSAGVNIPWQQRVDTLSVTMALFVTFVGTLIHIYAIGYMRGDSRFSRFFVYLNMFMMFMLTLISGNNFLMMFVGWEGVGLCSYLLIGFWWDKPKGEGWKNSNAAKKAFVANRIGDFGVLLAMFLMFWTFNTLDFYKPDEVTNLRVGVEHHGEEATEGEETTTGEETIPPADEQESETAQPTLSYLSVIAGDAELTDLGVYGQTQYWIYLEDRGQEHDVTIAGTTLPFDTLLVIMTLFLLLGATGKSAQIPLLVWLPDAMAGPTPVSALIHAATMVTAGVYMMVRSNVLFFHADTTSFIVTLVGASTALVAGFIAIAQFDIKRVLAYSTISQLGFMVAAVGLGAYTAAIFHMVTHSFFKALLFLGSGSVIHGMEHGHHHLAEHGGKHHDDEPFDPQDMRYMGGLRHKMPRTYWTYLIGTLALAGIFPLAGFWSKDEILADGWDVGFQHAQIRGYIALALLLTAAAFTAFYMWRQVEMIFHGDPRHPAAEHAQESSNVMTIPLLVLAFFSVVVGFINMPGKSAFLSDIFGLHEFGDFLGRTFYTHSLPLNFFIAATAFGVGVAAILIARQIYGNNKALNADGQDPLSVRPDTRALWHLAHARLYWDEIYGRLFVQPYNAAADFLGNTVDWRFWHDFFHNVILTGGYNRLAALIGKPIDLGLIDGTVNGVGRATKRISGLLRRTQTGYVRVYTTAVLLGAVIVLILMLYPLIKF